MKPRIIPEMNINEYHTDRSYSKTDIVRALRSTGYVRQMREMEQPDSGAKEMGSAVHSYVLEPEKALRDVAYSSAGSRKGKQYESDKALNLGKILLLEKEREAVGSMVESIWNHPKANELTTGGKAEHSIFADMEIEGHHLPMKCRPDYLPGSLRITDVKTTRNIAPEAFGKDSYNFHYHWSAFITTRMVKLLTGLDHVYYFVAVENKPPYETVVYQARPNIIALAEEEIMPVLQRLAIAHDSGRFQGIADNTILDLELPRWAYSKMKILEEF